MKRTGLGFFLLLTMLLAGLLSSQSIAQRNEPISLQLTQAVQATRAGQWDQAVSLAGEARRAWEENWHFCACFADHEPMEDIDGLFAQLEVYQNMEDPVSFAAVCGQLSKKIQAMGDAHGLNWWNFL